MLQQFRKRRAAVMSATIASILSPAVGILISPFPIVGLILILLSDRARVNSLVYFLGWLLGNTIGFLIGFILVGGAVSTQDDPSTIFKVILIILGILAIVFAVHSFMKRPKKGEEPQTPKWFAKMGTIKPLGALAFGVILSLVNPKNLALAVSAGVSLNASGAAVGQEVAATVIFVLIASASIMVPTIAFLFVGKKLSHVLDDVRVWLIHNNAVIMAVLMLFIGLDLIEKAL